MIPSGQIKWLNFQELALYGLDRDPVIEEAHVLEQARKYGLSRAEYERRSKMMDDFCGTVYHSATTKAQIDCMEGTMRAGFPFIEQQCKKSCLTDEEVPWCINR